MLSDHSPIPSPKIYSPKLANTAPCDFIFPKISQISRKPSLCPLPNSESGLLSPAANNSNNPDQKSSSNAPVSPNPNAGNPTEPPERERVTSGNEELEIQPSQAPSKITERPPPFERLLAMNLVDKLRAKFHITNDIVRCVLAEMFCTGFLVFGGTAICAQFTLSRRRMDEWTCVAIGWGLVLMFAVLMGQRISGAHLNPAVSFFQLIQGKLSPIKFIAYVIAQNIGAFFGSLLTFIVYYEGINQYDDGVRYVTGNLSTASIFATYPNAHLSVLGAIIDQVVGTAVLCMGIAAVTDRRNRIPPFMQPAFIGSLLGVLGMFMAYNAGYAINPARDFAPRLMTLIVGYSWRVFSYRSYTWFWIPIVCPMIGALIGAWLYEFFIGFHIPDDPETTYIHRILDDRNPDGQLREIHLVETKPFRDSEHIKVIDVEEQTKPTQYRNM